MSQRCPLCRTRLWTDPLFTPVQLECPRCGAVFLPTVRWGYFRVLIGLIVAISLVLVAVWGSRQLSFILLVILGFLVSLWFLPKLMDLQPVGRPMHLADNIESLDLERWELPLQARPWRDELREKQQETQF